MEFTEDLTMHTPDIIVNGTNVLKFIFTNRRQLGVGCCLCWISPQIWYNIFWKTYTPLLLFSCGKHRTSLRNVTKWYVIIQCATVVSKVALNVPTTQLNKQFSNLILELQI